MHSPEPNPSIAPPEPALVINTHPALQLERMSIVAARTRLGLTPPRGCGAD